MAEQVEIHKRQFTEELHKVIAAECYQKRIYQRGFEEVDLIKREISMGTKVVDKALPEPLRPHVQYKVDPFTYEISFYISVGYECDTCDNEFNE